MGVLTCKMAFGLRIMVTGFTRPAFLDYLAVITSSGLPQSPRRDYFVRPSSPRLLHCDYLVFLAAITRLSTPPTFEHTRLPRIHTFYTPLPATYACLLPRLSLIRLQPTAVLPTSSFAIEVW
jgi:hypothetical protein